MKDLLAKIIALFAASAVGISWAQTTGGGMPSSTDQNVQNVEVVANPGRDFRAINLSPNQQFLVFLEVDPKLADGTRLLKLEVGSHTLQYYDLPQGYVYMEPKLSHDGQQIVLRRNRNVKGDSAQLASLENPELVTMNVDGSHFKTYKVQRGDIFGPTFSNGGNKIAYWRASILPTGSGQMASRTDIWEYDVHTNSEKPFAGPFEFSLSGQIQYLPGDDEVLADAQVPRVFAQNPTEYLTRFNHSEIYRIKRAQTKLDNPLFTDVQYARLPAMDKERNTYFQAQQNAMYLFKETGTGNKSKWHIPNEFATMYGISVAANGGAIAFISSAPGTTTRDGRFEIGILDTGSGNWHAVTVPSLGSSTSIHVGYADVKVSSSH